MPRKKKNQREDKRFCVRLDIGKDADGKRIRKSFYSTVSLEDAEKKRNEWIKLNPPETLPSDRGITLSAWSERWLKAYKSGLAPNTFECYRRSAAALCRYDGYGSMPITDIRHSHIQAYLTSLAGKSKSYIHSAKVTIRQLFSSAVSDGLIAKLPYDSLYAPKGTYSGHRVLLDWEKKAIEATCLMHRAGLWAIIMQYAGLRRGEMAALMWEDIDLANRTITVRRSADLNHGAVIKSTKSDAGERTLPILKPLYNVLCALPSRSGFVCLSSKGQPLTKDSYRKGWESYMLVLERATNGIEPYNDTTGWRRDLVCTAPGYKVASINAHDLRYTFASYLYDNDVDIKTAQYLLGHSSVDMTLKIYTKLSEEKKAKSINKLIEFFDTHSDTQTYRF